MGSDGVRKRMSTSKGGGSGSKMRGVVGGIRSLRGDTVEETGSTGSGATSPIVYVRRWCGGGC